MKKIIAMIFATMLFLTTAAQAAEIGMHLTMTSGGQSNEIVIVPLVGDDGTPQGPIIENGELLLPLRSVFEAMGAVVIYDDIEREVSGGKGIIYYTTAIGTSKLFANGEEYNLSNVTILVNGRTMIGTDAIEKCFGAEVNYFSEENKVSIIYNEDDILTIDFSELEASYDE